MKQRAFVRYTKSGKIVPGSMIITQGDYPKGPAVWAEVTVDLCCDNPADSFSATKKKGWVRYTKAGKIVPGSLVITDGYPKGSGGTWKRVSIDLCCDYLPSNCIEFVVDTTEGTFFAFSFNTLGPINFTVDWGDGTVHPDAGAGGFYLEEHTFPADDTQYTVRVCFDDINSVTELNLSND